MTQADPLATALWEGDRHLAVLEQALGDWHRAPAPDLAELDADSDKLRVLDQLLFRFTKLQDAMGTRLVPATLTALSEPVEDWPMIDRLNRLEKLGFLDADAWLRWRQIRNQLSHEYPDRPDTRFAALTAAVTAAGELAQAYRDWRQRLATMDGPA
jgi:hypothetical protein